ncbi:MAG: hypothetical protein JW822_11125 [Spirochaetales bacterium]|nr:hypothetical protein [Spirochaetales bacterium]
MDKKNLIFCLLFCLEALFLFGNTLESQNQNILLFPENYEIRQQLKDELLEPLLDIRSRAQYFPLWGTQYRVKYEKLVTNNDVFYSFINETKQGFPRDSRGSFTIKRDRANGMFRWMKIAIRQEPYCYLKITPDERRCVLDLYLFNILLYRKIVIPMDFLTLVFEPFSKIARLTENVIDWQLVLNRGNADAYYDIQNTVHEIRKLYKTIREVDDGAQNSSGRFVFIESGAVQGALKGFNCSGFAKWIVDGFYVPLTHSWIDIENLKLKHMDLRGNRWNKEYDKYRDLYFGLDWTRNLAVALEQARSGESLSYEDADVRYIKYFKYREDSGYPVKDLKLLLYILATREPGHFYLASVNNLYPKNPLFRQHFHVAALFPFFDTSGNFQIVVLDQHAEQSIDSFIDKYSSDFIHLVRIKAFGEFSLSAVE